MSLASLVRPNAPGEDPLGVLLVGLAAATAGIVTWYLPWDSWQQWASLLLVPVGFCLIALRNVLGGDDPYLYGVFFVIVFVWVGLAQPRWTGLKLLPLFAVAYIVPALYGDAQVAQAASSAVYVGLACALVAETLAWVTTALRRSRMSILRAQSAVRDIGAELASTTNPSELWSSMSMKLSRLVELPDCDVYRLMDDGTLHCLASVWRGEPYPDYLGLREDADLWAVDKEAMRTRRPVLISSPDDPRLSQRERDDMRRWDERVMLIVPLIARDEVIGLVEISESRVDRTIDPEQIANVISICQLIAMSIKDAEVLRSQEEQALRMASLFASSRAVASAQNVEEALAIVTRSAGEVLGVSECVAYEHDQDRDAIVARAMWEKTPSGWDRLGEPLPLDGDLVSRTVLETGQPLVEQLSDPRLDPASRAEMEEWGEKSCLTVPMQSVEGPTGILAFWDSACEHDYTDDEIALATALGELAGEAVRSAKLLRRLRRLSETDSLTGLANHRMIHTFLDREQARAQRYGTHFSLAMLDIDGFKLLNDTYGHPGGDVVLRQVAGLLKVNSRGSDVVGRYGGDEFLVLMPETSATAAGAVAEKLRAALAAAPYVTEAGEQIPIHASFGIAAYPQDGEDANALVVMADANLYASKRRGGDAVTGAEERQPSKDDEAAAYRSLRVAGDRGRQQGLLHAAPQRRGHRARTGARRCPRAVRDQPARLARRRPPPRRRQDRHPRSHPAQAGAPHHRGVRARQGTLRPRRDDHRRHTRRGGDPRRRRLPSRTLRRHRLPSRPGGW